MSDAWQAGPVALVVPLYPPAQGGVERYVERLASGLHRRGIPVEVITTDPAVRAPRSELVDGIRVRRFPTLTGNRLVYPSPSLARWLAREGGRYALLHAHNLHTLVPLAAVWAARRTSTPLVLTPHYHGTGHTPLRALLHVPYRPVAGLVARSAARVICNSEAERALLLRDFGPALRTVTIAEGIDPPGATAAGDPGSAGDRSSAGGRGSAGDRGSALGQAGATDPDGASGLVTILSVGRLEAYKGIGRVVEALPHLPADHRLVVVGGGPAQADLERRAAELGVADRMIMRGRIPDAELQGWHASAAVAVSLSLHESFGLSVLEAAAAGCPVVASDIPAHREATAFVGPGRIRLVPLDSTPEALASAITAAREAGRTSDRSGWHLPTWDGLVERTLATYREVLEERRRDPLDAA